MEKLWSFPYAIVLQRKNLGLDNLSSGADSVECEGVWGVGCGVWGVGNNGARVGRKLEH